MKLTICWFSFPLLSFVWFLFRHLRRRPSYDCLFFRLIVLIFHTCRYIRALYYCDMQSFLVCVSLSNRLEAKTLWYYRTLLCRRCNIVAKLCIVTLVDERLQAHLLLMNWSLKNECRSLCSCSVHLLRKSNKIESAIDAVRRRRSILTHAHIRAEPGHEGL